MKTTQTEADLGLAPTDEEMATAIAPSGDDDIQQDDDEPAVAAKAADPAPAADPAKPVDKPAEEGKTVDLRALQEARAEAREAKQRSAILEQRWNDFLASQAPKPEAKQPDPIPEAGSDPMAALAWTQQQILEQQRQAQQTAQADQTRQQEEQAYQQAAAVVGTQLQSIQAADPTVQEAYVALRESQGRELMAMGWSQQDALAEINRLERQHVLYMAHNRLDPAAYIKNLAQARGWAPKAAEAVAAPAAPKTDLAAVAAAQQRHQSLSDAPGGETIAPLDAKQLARMSDKDFKAWMSKKGNEDRFDDIMGR